MNERDYIDRTIATVRNHRDADNCWPQWANIFADEIERLRALIVEHHAVDGVAQMVGDKCAVCARAALEDSNWCKQL